MASFSPYTRPVQPAAWVDPMNLDLLRQGNMYKEDIARQNLADLSQSYQTLANLPAYGKDAEKLQSKLEGLRNQVSSLNLSDVSDYNTLGQIKGVINQFSSDPEIMDIAQRWIPYEKERKIQEEMRLKDKEYFSPIIDQGNSYIQNGEWIKGKRFTGNGFINKNLTKEYQDVLSKLQKQKKQKVVNGIVTEELSYDPDELDRITDEFYSNPAIKQQLEYQINKDANIDWEKQGQEILLRNANLYKNNAQLKSQQLPTISDPKEYQKTLQEIESYNQEASKLEQMANSQDNAEYAKSNYMNKMLDGLKKDAKEKAQFFSEEGRKYDELYMENVKNSNDLYKERYKDLLDRGIDPKTGLPLTDATGRPLPAKADKEGKPTEKQVEINRIIGSVSSRPDKKITNYDLQSLADKNESVKISETPSQIKGKKVGDIKIEVVIKGTPIWNPQTQTYEYISGETVPQITTIDDYLRKKTGKSYSEISNSGIQTVL